MQVDAPRLDNISEIGVERSRDTAISIAATDQTIDTLEYVRARLARDFNAETGEHWTPRASYTPKKNHEVTASGAEATKVLNDVQRKHDQARIPQGTAIAVTGRDGPSRETVFAALNEQKAKTPDMYLMHGNAPGSQRFAGEWARENGVTQVTFLPNRQDGRAKVTKRDQKILDASPRLVIDFSDAQKPTVLAESARAKEIPVLSITDYYQHTSDPKSQDRSPASQNPQHRKNPRAGPPARAVYVDVAPFPAKQLPPDGAGSRRTTPASSSEPSRIDNSHLPPVPCPFTRNAPTAAPLAFQPPIRFGHRHGPVTSHPLILSPVYFNPTRRPPRSSQNLTPRRGKLSPE